MPDDCVEDTSEITHSIIHEHKYTHKTQSTLSLSLEGTHTSETVNTTSYACQHMHSQVKHFSINKYNLSNSTQTDKTPIHKHLYSDQYYHINSIANSHIEK